MVEDYSEAGLERDPLLATETAGLDSPTTAPAIHRNPIDGAVIHRSETDGMALNQCTIQVAIYQLSETYRRIFRQHPAFQETVR